ncbi:MAG: DUF4199 domain-containing protein [Bacteroidota bacterium]
MDTISNNSTVQTTEKHKRRREKWVDASVSSYILSFGLITASLLATYFLLVGIFDFRHVIEYRYFNIIPLTIGVIWALRTFHKRSHHNRTHHFNGFMLGLGTAALASFLYGLFVLLFIDVIGPEMGVSIQDHLDIGGLTTEWLAVFTVLEGTMSGVMVSFIAMQYFKNVRFIEE